MRLTRLQAQGFRNLQPLDVGTDARFVVVHGPNAQGKTNTLEAVWWLAALRPLRGHRPADLVGWGAEEAVVTGTVRSARDTRVLRVALAARRVLTIDGVEERDLGAWFDGVRAIAFQPSDAAMVTEGPALRRSWLDRAAFTARPAHLEVVRTYRRALAQKAAALRAARVDEAVLDALDAGLADAGGRLVGGRLALLGELTPHIRAQHAAIAGATAGVSLRYRTAAPGDTPAARSQALAERLCAGRAEELRRRMCLVGPHKDELVVGLDGQAARTFGSRGQVRTLVLAMKLEELVAARARGDRPLFLLDDLSSELDAARTAHLVAQLIDLDAQVWVTTTDPSLLGALPAGEVVSLAVSGGRVQVVAGAATPVASAVPRG